MFDTAVDYGLINFNPSRVLSKNQLKFKLPSGNQPVFTLDERNKVMIYLKNLDKQTVYTLAVQLAFCFCLRIGKTGRSQ